MAAVTAAVLGGIALAGAGVAMYQQEKAEDKAYEEAREQEQRAIEEQRRQETDAIEEQRRQETEAKTQAEAAVGKIEAATKMTPEELERQARTFELEKTRQTELQRRAGLSGEELLRELGPETRQLLDEIAAERGLTGEELFKREGEIPKTLVNQVLEEGRAPEAFYQSTLDQELELARQMVNAEANRRGVFAGQPEGGIRFEQLGRAGIDLAIKSAGERMVYRQQALSNLSNLATQFQQLRGIATGRAAEVGTAAAEQKQLASAELAGFLADIQTLREQGRARETGGVITGQQLGADITQAGYARGSQTYREGADTATQNLLALRGYDIATAGEDVKAFSDIAGTTMGSIFGGIPSGAGVGGGVGAGQIAPTQTEIGAARAQETSLERLKKRYALR